MRLLMMHCQQTQMFLRKNDDVLIVAVIVILVVVVVAAVVVVVAVAKGWTAKRCYYYLEIKGQCKETPSSYSRLNPPTAEMATA